jgi:hypothetical protein
MICINANIPKEFKAIYHSKDTICFYIFKNKNKRNEFIKKTKGMSKNDREIVYQKYQS